MIDILDDKRTIKAIDFNDGEGGGYSRDRGYDIVAYPEYGPHNYIAFFSVTSPNGNVIARVPATQVSVFYEDE